MEKITKLLGVCITISILLNVLLGSFIILRLDENQQLEGEPVEPIMPNDGNVLQTKPIPLVVDFDETMFYFIDNDEVTSTFEIIFNYLSSEHIFYFSLNPDFHFLNASRNTEVIERYFLNVHVRSGANYFLFRNDEHYTDRYGVYAETGHVGWQYGNKLYLELRDIDDFIVEESFKIYWHESKSDDYLERKTFTFRFLNLESIRLLKWDIPERYIVSVDRNQLITNWEAISEEHTNGWYRLPGILKHDTDPWRDYPVEFWYNPTTYKTQIVEVKP